MDVNVSNIERQIENQENKKGLAKTKEGRCSYGNRERAGKRFGQNFARNNGKRFGQNFARNNGKRFGQNFERNTEKAKESKDYSRRAGNRRIDGNNMKNFEYTGNKKRFDRNIKDNGNSNFNDSNEHLKKKFMRKDNDRKFQKDSGNYKNNFYSRSENSVKKQGSNPFCEDENLERTRNDKNKLFSESEEERDMQFKSDNSMKLPNEDFIEMTGNYDESHMKKQNLTRSERKKKYYVNPLMFYMAKEQEFISKIDSEVMKRSIIVYGFDANYKKKELMKLFTETHSEMLKEIEKVTILSFARPMAFVVLKNEEITKTIFNILDEKFTEFTVSRTDTFAVKVPKKSKLEKSKVIIRNLHFKATESLVYDKFKFCGPILSIKFLTKIGENGKLIRKGCCFVQYTESKDALRAVKLMNETSLLGRPIVVDVSVTKEIFTQKLDDSENKPARKNSNETFFSSASDEHISDAKNESDFSSNDSEMSENEKDHSENVESNDGILNWEITDNSNKDQKNDQKSKKQLNDEEEIGRTVFVQNISWVTQEDDFASFMESKFGKTEFCKFVIDKEFNQPKGTAFVRFVNKKSYNDCLHHDGTFNSAQADVTLDGKNLIFVPALKRDDLKTLKNDSTKKPKTDKRNLSLTNIGLVYDKEEQSKNNDQFTKHEENVRKQALADKKAKLKNPNFFISPKRLCIRNIPSYVDETLFSRTFQKLGNKCPLKSARLIRHKTKAGKGKLAGYGFVEYTQPSGAMAAIKACANKFYKDIFKTKDAIEGDNSRILAEFAVENVQILKKKKALATKKKRSSTNNKARYFNANDKTTQKI